MSSAVAPPPTAGPAERLDRLVGLLDESERQLRRAVLLAGELSGSGAAEAVEGLPLELFMGLRHRMPQADARMVITAVRRLTGEQRAESDARIDATAPGASSSRPSRTTSWRSSSVWTAGRSSTGRPTRRGRRLFDGLVKICGEWLGGGPGKPARPLLVTHVECSWPDLYGLLEQGLRDAHSGQVTVTCRNRTWRSLPRGTPLARPPNRPDRPDDRAPPGMPF